MALYLGDPAGARPLIEESLAISRTLGDARGVARTLSGLGTVALYQDDLKAARACVELCGEVGNSVALKPFIKREVMPGNLKGADLDNFIRDAAVTYWHQTCTAKMGRDAMSVVDGHLKVYGIDNLRVADGSIMPRVTTGNTMAPCVIIGERAGEILRAAHKI